VLDEISGGDAEMKREALVQFQAVNVDDGLALTNALEVRDLAGVTRMAHRIRGASSTLGAEALADVCHRLEVAARSNDWEEVVANQDALLRELARAKAYIEAVVGKEAKQLAAEGGNAKS
jgi:HPt (histidine-containing phosphotransfer) domain-containing protein